MTIAEQTPLKSLIQAHSRQLADQLSRHRERSFPPSASKTFRKLTPGEACRLLAVADSTLRQAATDAGIGESAGTRRAYSLTDLAVLRDVLATGSRTPLRYRPHRQPSEHLQTIVVMNFKGGSGKTTTAAHLAQYLAMRGYRVLAMDLDPQASLTALFGVHSVIDLPANATIYGAIRYDSERVSLADVIRPTYVPGLDLAPGGLELMEFEHETPRALAQGAQHTLFFDRVAEAMQTIDDRYDIAIIDCPPQLGYLTLSALVAATAVLITVHPEMLDVMSMSQFLAMAGDLLQVVSAAIAGGEPRYDWFRYLLTRFEPNDGPQNQMAGFLRANFGPYVLNNPTLKSTTISDAGLTNQTLYEVDRRQFTRLAYDRALESVDAVNGEVEALVRTAWGRS